MTTIKAMAIISIILSTTVILALIVAGSTNLFTYGINVSAIALSVYTLNNMRSIDGNRR
jgi:hypothetical protein